MREQSLFENLVVERHGFVLHISLRIEKSDDSASVSRCSNGSLFVEHLPALDAAVRFADELLFAASRRAARMSLGVIPNPSGTRSARDDTTE